MRYEVDRVLGLVRTDWLSKTDHVLGGLLVPLFAAEQARSVGGTTFGPDLVEFCRIRLLTLEAANLRDAALEGAFHLAAQGDFEKAGRLFRGHLLMHAELDGASRVLVDLNAALQHASDRAVAADEKLLAPKKMGGQATARMMKEQAAATKSRVHAEASRLLKEKDPRNVVAIAAANLGLSLRTVRTYLATHQSGHWAKKEKEKRA